MEHGQKIVMVRHIYTCDKMESDDWMPDLLANNIQVNLIITLSFGSMETDSVISEPYYNEVIYNRHLAK